VITRKYKRQPLLVLLYIQGELRGSTSRNEASAICYVLMRICLDNLSENVHECAYYAQPIFIYMQIHMHLPQWVKRVRQV
jgi:hypothetical protein